MGRLVLAAAALAVAAAGIDVVRIASQLDRVAIDLPTEQPGTTWLLIGSDSRSVDLPEQYEGAYGTTTETPGARADVVLLLHEEDGAAAAVAVPRDLLVDDPQGRVRRLALLLEVGPQAIVDAVCTSLGAAVDHVAVLEADGFIELVDAVGPLPVHVDRPLRDEHTGLDIPVAGDVELDGGQALALVRSRQREELIDGVWVPTTDGATDRAQEAVGVLAQLQHELAGIAADPLDARHLAGVVAGDLQLDDHASLVDLWDLGRMGAGTAVDVLPTVSAGGELSVVLAPEAPDVLRAAGLDGGCRLAA